MPRLAGVFFLRGRVVDCMMSFGGRKGDDDLRAVREKKKEDIGQRKRRRRRATVLQTNGAARDNWREGVGVENGKPS
jgi:hypothetical protein